VYKENWTQNYDPGITFYMHHSRSRVPMLNFVWTNHNVNDRCCFVVCGVKIYYKSALSVIVSVISGAVNIYAN